jgi:hypothetical protein
MENLGMLSMRAGTNQAFQSANLPLGVEQGAARRPENMQVEARPVWLSALEASSCRAQSHGEYHEVRWQHVCGRATYTNLGSEEVHIEPLGVRVPRGKTVAVSWLPGETEYTVEVYKQ